MPNQTMPDSNYDIDKQGYGILWQTAKQFHSELLTKSRWFASGQGRAHPEPADVKQALAEINDEIHQKLRQDEIRKNERQVNYKELLIAFGSGFIGLFLGRLVDTLANQSAIESVSWWYWVSLALGLVLITLSIRPQKS
jgi:hypothetical protein